MAKYKVTIPNTFSIGKFTSEGGILNVTNPSKKEQLKIDNAVANGILKESKATTSKKVTDDL